MYESIKIEDFLKLVTFTNIHEAEKNLVEIVKKKIVPLRIDHQNGVIHFGLYITSHTDFRWAPLQTRSSLKKI